MQWVSEVNIGCDLSIIPNVLSQGISQTSSIHVTPSVILVLFCQVIENFC